MDEFAVMIPKSTGRVVYGIFLPRPAASEVRKNLYECDQWRCCLMLL